MLRWSDGAKSAISWFYRPLQDVDVYVEDRGDTAFYTELLRRLLADDGVRIARVFEAGGCEGVLSVARSHDHSTRRAAFLIDGDFAWVRGEAAPLHASLCRLDAYCVENVIIEESGVAAVLAEQNASSVVDAQRALEWDKWIATLGPLVDLFAVFAVINQKDPTKATCSRGVQELLVHVDKQGPRLDDKKIAAVIAEITRHIDAAVGSGKAAALIDLQRKRISALHRSVDAVSGKDYLLPMLRFHLATLTKERAGTKSLRFRLARHCDLSGLQSLRAVIIAAASA